MMSSDLARIQSSLSSTKHRFHVEGDKRSVLAELQQRFPFFDRGSWPLRFAMRGVYLNGRPIGIDATAEHGDLLEYYEPHYEPERAREFFPQLSDKMVVFEDDDFVVAFKPAGLPSTPPRDQALHTMQSYIGELLSTRRGNVQRTVHLPSRLDVNVSGLLLVTLSERMNRHIQRAYDARTVEKYYLAELSTFPPWGEREIRHPIGRSPDHPILRRVDFHGGETAHTSVAVISPSLDGKTLVKAEPLTGRTHQIRLHLAEEGFPIVGDPFYGGVEAAELHLVSFALGIHHPWRNERLFFQVPEQLWPTWLTPYASELHRLTAMRRFSTRDDDR